MNKMKSKYFKVFLIIVACIAIVLMSLILFAGYEMEWKRTTIAEFENKSTGYKVIFQELGITVFFGKSDVRVALVDSNGRTVGEIKDSIANDGGKLDEENISVVWQSDGVEITLYGEEQENRSYKLEY